MSSQKAIQNSTGRQTEVLAALALGCVYLAVVSGHLLNIDGYVMFSQAKYIVYHHSLTFDHPIGPYMTSKYGIGTSLAYVPGLIAFSWLRSSGGFPVGSIPANEQWAIPFYTDPLYMLAGTPVQVLITVISAYLVARFVRELGFSRAAALWGLALYGVASPAIVYMRADTSQPLEGMCWIAALYFALLYRHGKPQALWLCMAGLFYAVLTRPVEGTLLMPCVVLVVAGDLRFWRWTRTSLIAARAVEASFVIAFAVMLAINWSRYGSPLRTGYEGEYWELTVWIGLAGALFSPGRGIPWEFPAVLLTPFGVRALMGSGQKVILLALGGLAGLQLLNVAGWYNWWGGWDFGLRLFVPAFPLLAVLAACGIDGLWASLRRWLPAILLTAGVVWTVPGLVTDMNSGYAGRFDSASANFQLDAYLPMGAWPYFDHWLAVSGVDFHAADILWLRLAHLTDNLSLLPPVLLIIAASGLAARVIALQRQELHAPEMVVSNLVPDYRQ